MTDEVRDMWRGRKKNRAEEDGTDRKRQEERGGETR